MKKNEIEKQINNLSEEEAKDKLYELMIQCYTVVPWPDSQEFMDKWWFKKEAVLDIKGKFGSSTYFIPTFRLM